MGERIALGMGCNTDLELRWDTSVAEGLIREYGIRDAELDPAVPVSDARSLLVSLLGYLKAGLAGERGVDDERAAADFAGAFGGRVTLGGTAPRAALALDKLGLGAALHLAAMNDEVRRLLPGRCPWVSSAREDASYPHLIVQYEAGQRVRALDVDIRVERPNRVIFVRDPENEAMDINPAFADLARDARVFLVSGFNAMRDAALLQERMETMDALLAGLRPDALVVYEDACYHRPGLGSLARRALLPRIGLYSMNEDEMAGLLGRKVALLDPEEVLAALADLRRLLPVPALVVHTRHWALAAGDGAERWTGALRGGIAMATSRFVHGDAAGGAEYRAALALESEEESAAFARTLEERGRGLVACVPSSRVPEGRKTTIGLGDAFAGGLIAALD